MKKFEELARGTQKKIIRLGVVIVVVFVCSPVFSFLPTIIKTFAWPIFFIATVFYADKIQPEAFLSWVGSLESSVRKIHPTFKTVPGMAVIGVLLAVLLSIAGFFWSWTAGLK